MYIIYYYSLLSGWSYPATARKKLTKILLAEKQQLECSQFELFGEPDNRYRPLVIDEHLEEFNDDVWIKGYSIGKPSPAEKLRWKHIYSRDQKLFYKFRTGDPQDWAEVHICTVRRYMNGKVIMYDNQTDKPKELSSVIDLIPYMPWYHSVYKMKFMDDVELPDDE